MRKNILLWIFFGVMLSGSVCVAESSSEIEATKSKSLADRINGFYALVDTGGPFVAPSCGFKVADSSSAKKAIVDLLKSERRFDLESRVDGKYTKEIALQQEAYSEYMADLGLFVDSCEEESAIDAFPGSRTFNKYPQKTTEAILLALNDMQKNGLAKNRDAYILRYLGKSSILFKVSNNKLYEMVKSKLVVLVDDNELSVAAVNALSALNDVDLIPVFEKISKYDDSKGTIRISGGKKSVDPISGIAKKALDKLRQEKNKNK